MGFSKNLKILPWKAILLTWLLPLLWGSFLAKLLQHLSRKCLARSQIADGGIDLNSKKLVLKDAVAEVKDAAISVVTTKAAPELAIQWGEFITVMYWFHHCCFL